MTDRDWSPRLTIELTEEQYNELLKLVPWGIKRKLFSVIIDDIIRLLKEHGQKFLAAILTRSIKLEEYTHLLEESDDNKRKDS